MLDGILIPIFQTAYDILYWGAVILWGLNQALLMVVFYIMTLTAWFAEQMFSPVISLVSQQTSLLLPSIVTIAALIMAIGYMLAVFGVAKLVEPKSALAWLLAATFIFSFAPSLYLGIDSMRRGIASGFYQAVFQDLQAGSSSIEGLNYIVSADSGTLQVQPLLNNFASFLPSYDLGIDGADVALAYLNADGCDVLRSPGCLVAGELPLRWYITGAFFDLQRSSLFFPVLTAAERQAALKDEMTGIWVLLSALALSLFALVESIINFCLTIAFAFSFISLLIALPFAFFKRTESIPQAALDVILGLFIQSIITALLLALVMSFIVIAAGTGNGFLLFGVSFIGIILLVVLLYGAVSAILQAANGLVGAFANVTGGNLGAAGKVTDVAGNMLASGTVAAMTGSLTQAAGAALGPGAAQKAYYAARTFGEDSLMGQVAGDIATGGFAGAFGPLGALGLAQTQANFTSLPGIGPTVRRLGALGTRIESEEADEGNPMTDSIEAISRRSQGRALNHRRKAMEDSARNESENADLLPSDDAFLRYMAKLNRMDADASLGTSPQVENSETALASRRQGLSAEDIAKIDEQDDDDFAQVAQRLGTGINGNLDKADAKDLGTIRQIALATTLNPTEAGRPVGGTWSNGVWTDWAGKAEGVPPIPYGELMNFDRSPKLNGDGSAMIQRLPDGTEQLHIQDLSQVNPLQTNADGNALTGAGYRLKLDEDGRSYLEARAAPGIVVQNFEPKPEGKGLTETGVSSLYSEVAHEAAFAAPVTELKGIGTVTADKLAGVGIQSVGDLANAHPATMSQLEGFSPARATWLVQSAQDQLGMVASPQAPSPRDFAAALDASNDGNQARLVTELSAGIERAMSQLSGGDSLGRFSVQAATHEAGLGGAEAERFVGQASVLRLEPQQTNAIMQDVSATGQIGAQLRESLASSVAGLQLPNGQAVDSQKAMMALEQSASALLNAASASRANQPVANSIPDADPLASNARKSRD